MKLEAVNSRIGPGIEVFSPKDVSIWNKFSVHLLFDSMYSTIRYEDPKSCMFLPYQF